LSAFTLSHDKPLLDRAVELGDRLGAAFQESFHHIPYSDVDLHSGAASLGMGKVSVSEATTVQLEFKALTDLSGNKKYFEWMEDCADTIDLMRTQLPSDSQGLVPMFIDLHSQTFERGSTITLGARGDSYYEYLLKQYLLTGKTQQKYLDRYLEAMDNVDRHLVSHTEGSEKFLFIGERMSGNLSPKMDHLVCFLPGLLALGKLHNVASDPVLDRHMEIAKGLMRTCVAMYTRTATGLAPEIVHFNLGPHQSNEMYIKPADAHNILRPETVESLMYLYRVTDDKQYQDWGWDIFNAFEKHSRISSGGYSGLRNVDTTSYDRMDKMESFFLAETLKYLFLLFDDSKTLIPLDKFVFNTEAHPFRVFFPK
jgi:hypothetical protein